MTCARVHLSTYLNIVSRLREHVAPHVLPHPDLTPIVGKPNNKSLQLLQNELYANARAVHLMRGGGMQMAT